MVLKPWISTRCKLGTRCQVKIFFCTISLVFNDISPKFHVYFLYFSYFLKMICFWLFSQGEMGPQGPSGPLGETGIGLPGPKVSLFRFRIIFISSFRVEKEKVNSRSFLVCRVTAGHRGLLVYLARKVKGPSAPQWVFTTNYMMPTVSHLSAPDYHTQFCGMCRF